MGVYVECFLPTQTSPRYPTPVWIMTRPKQNKAALPLKRPSKNTHFTQSLTHTLICTLHLLLPPHHPALMTGHKKTGKEAMIPVMPWKLVWAAGLCLNMRSPQHWLTSDVSHMLGKKLFSQLFHPVDHLHRVIVCIHLVTCADYDGVILLNSSTIN